MILYSTVLDEGTAEQVIEKSRFVSYAAPASSKEEAQVFIDTVKKKNKDATHNVPAMVIGDKFQIQWASDDGEPQGTSGAPIVQMLVNEGLTDVAVVVTRYFGGVKLGTGGLVRAYTSSAKAAVEAAGICSVKEMTDLNYLVDYGDFNKVQNYNFQFDVEIKNINYTDKVAFDLVCDPKDRESTKKIMSDISKGNAVITTETIGLEKIPIK